MDKIILSLVAQVPYVKVFPWNQVLIILTYF